jgi:hypothetical protein
MLRGLLKPFSLSFAFAFFSALVAQRYFFDFREMATCAFTALGLSSLLSQLLDENRREIWELKNSPWTANTKLAAAFSALFMGIFVAIVFLAWIADQSYQNPDLSQLYENEIASLFLHNAAILVTGTLLAIVYRAGGLVLILAWNALHWAEAIFSYIQQVRIEVGLSNAALLFATILPHLLLEALAYVLAGLSGVFISIAFCKYAITSPEIKRVAFACMTLLVVSLAVLVLATSFEIYLAQPLFHALRAS